MNLIRLNPFGEDVTCTCPFLFCDLATLPRGIPPKLRMQKNFRMPLTTTRNKRLFPSPFQPVSRCARIPRAGASFLMHTPYLKDIFMKK